MAHDMSPGPNGDTKPLAEPTTDGASGLASSLQQWVGDTRALVGEQLNLLALESQRAGRALGYMAAMGLAAGLLLAGAWGGLGIACALWLMEQGARPSVALLACSLLNLAGVCALVWGIRRQSAALTFSATRRSLQGSLSEAVAP